MANDDSALTYPTLLRLELKKYSALAWVTFAYVSLISLWFVLWLTLGDANWVLALANRVVPFLFLPVPILVALCLYRRAWSSACMLILPLGIFFGFYLPYFIPKWNSGSTKTPELKVMTYNVLFKNENYDAVAKNILTYEPDFVALQEVQPAMFAALVQRLQHKYPYSAMATEHHLGTTTILSRHPISEQRVLDLGFDRPAILIQTEIKNKPLYFVSTHLTAFNLLYIYSRDIPRMAMLRTTQQNQQAQKLAEYLAPLQGIKIIGCDCNTYETTSAYRNLNQHFQNSARETAFSFNAPSFPNTHQDSDLQHIDYVFYQGALEPLQTLVIENKGNSDHSPVLSLFHLQ